jgi:hypothetical protein
VSELVFWVLHVGKAVKYVVSPKAWSCTLYFDDGSKSRVDFKNFLKTFKNYTRAVHEYCMYVWALANNSSVGDAAVGEIKSKLLPA